MTATHKKKELGANEFTTAMAADYLCLDTSTVYKINRRNLPFVHKLRRGWRARIRVYLLSDLNAYKSRPKPNDIRKQTAKKEFKSKLRAKAEAEYFRKVESAALDALCPFESGLVFSGHGMDANYTPLI